MSEYIPKLRRPLRNSSRFNSDSSNISGNSKRYNFSSRVSESDSRKRLRFIDDNNITSTQTEIEKDRRKSSAAEFLKSKENSSYLSNNINNYINMSRSNSSSSSSRINRYTPQLSDITSSNERTSINNVHRSRINELSNNNNNNKYDSLNTAPIRRLNNNNLPINSKRILRNDTNRIRQLKNSRINKPLINSNRNNNNNSSLSRSILSSLSNAGSKLFKSLLVTEPTNDNTQTSTRLGYTSNNNNSNIKYEVDTTIKNKLPLPYLNQRTQTNQLPLIPQSGSNGQIGYNGQTVYSREPVYQQEPQYQTQYRPQQQPQQQQQQQQQQLPQSQYDLNNINSQTENFNPRSISSSTVSSFGTNPEFSMAPTHSMAPTSLSSNIEKSSNLIDKNQQITVNLPETTQFILEQVKDLRIELQEMKSARERDSRKYESEREEYRIEKELKINELDIKCRQLEKENDNLLTILKDKDRDILKLQETNDKIKKNLRVLRLLSEQKEESGYHDDDEDEDEDDDYGNEYYGGEGNTGSKERKADYDIDDDDFDYIQLLTKYCNNGIGGGLRNDKKRRRLKNMKKPVKFKEIGSETEYNDDNDNDNENDDKPSNYQTVDDKLKKKIKNMEMKLSNLNSKLEDQTNQAREIKNEINKP